LYKKNQKKWKRLILDSKRRAYIRIDWDNLPKDEEKIEPKKGEEIKKSGRFDGIINFIQQNKKNLNFLLKFSQVFRPLEFSIFIFTYVLMISYFFTKTNSKVKSE
jgi:hypothetical protein